MKNENLVPVYTKQLALSLRRLGYHIIKTEPNDRFPQFDIYYFEDAPGLQDKILEYQKEKTK
jgi:hypothetical protein